MDQAQKEAIARALIGFGAGYKGQGAQALAQLQELDSARRKAFLEDVRSVRMRLDENNAPAAVATLQDRLHLLKQLPDANSFHTEEFLKMAQDPARIEELKTGLKSIEDRAVQAGELPSLVPEYGDTIQTDQGPMKFNKTTGAYDLVSLPGGAKPVAPVGAANKYQFGGGNLFVDDAGVLFSGVPVNDPATGGTSYKMVAIDGSGKQPSSQPQLVNPIGLTAAQIPQQKAAEEGAKETAKLNAQIKISPRLQKEIAMAVETGKNEIKAGVIEKDQQRTFSAYRTAMDNVLSAAGNTDTGPLIGRLPALSTNQQLLQGAIDILKAQLKAIIRIAGEGNWSDKDQQMVDNMALSRTDTAEAFQLKAAQLDAYLMARLGIGLNYGGQEEPVQTSGEQNQTDLSPSARRWITKQ